MPGRDQPGGVAGRGEALLGSTMYRQRYVAGSGDAGREVCDPPLVRALVMLTALALASACDAESVNDAGPADAGGPPTTVGPAERPAALFVPPAYDGATPLPLVLLLHGYGASAELQDLYFGATRTARTEGVYVLMPDGTIDADGNRFWDVVGTVVDDHAYLRALIEETMSLVPVASGEVYVLGHSNGGFMAYRLACGSSDRIAAIATLAGSEATEPACEPTRAVSVLQLHGTADGTVAYDGGTIHGLDFPSAPEVVSRWAMRAGCDVSAPETLAPLDLVSDIDGAETTVTAYRSGCADASTELWSMQGADHIPALTRTATPSVLAWLRAHARQ